MDLDASHTRAATQRENLYFIFLLDSSRDERSRNHRAKTFHHEGAIDGQTEGPVSQFGRGHKTQPLKCSFQPVEAITRPCADGNYGRAFQERAQDEILDFQRHEIKNLRLYKIRFCDHDKPRADAQQFTNVKVLAGLRLDRFISGHHQKNQINPADTRQHVFDKALVARNINKGNP